MTADTTAAKTCVKCGKNLDGQKRMKDSKGVYWCPDCGKADQEQKAAAAERASAAMVASAAPSFISRLKDTAGASGNKSRLIGMIVLLVVLVAIAVYLNIH